MAFTAGHGVIQLSLGTGVLRSSMASVSKMVGKFQGRLTRLTGAFGGIGTKMMAGAGIGLAVKAFVSFEDQMAEVSTMLDDTGLHMGNFTKSIRSMSIEFGESTSTLAKGLYDILSASIAPEKALSVLAVSARAAKAGVTDTGVAADAITTILNSYGLAAEKAGDVSDWLFSVVKRGKTNFATLAPSIGNVASIAANAGLSLEELGASLAVMTRGGVKTDLAVTALNAILMNFLKPTDDAAKYAKKLGFEMSSATLKAEGIAGVFSRISKLPPEAVTRLFPNVRAIKGIMPAIRNMEGFAEDIGIITGRAGATEVAYKKMAATMGHAFRQAKQSTVALVASIGESLAPALKAFTGWVQTALGPMREWIGQHQRLVAGIVGVVAGLGALSIIGPVIATMFGTLIAVIGLVVSPIGLLIAGLALMAKRFLWTKLAGESFGEKLSSLKGVIAGWWEYIKPIWEKFKLGVIWAFVAVKVAVMDWKTTLKMALVGAALIALRFADKVKHVFTTVIPWAMTTAMYGVLKFVDATKHFFLVGIPRLLDWFARNWKNIFWDLVEVTKSVFTNLGTNISALWTAIKGFLSGKGWDFDWTPLLKGFERTTEKIPDIMEGMVQGDLTKVTEKEMARLGGKLGTVVEGELTKQVGKHFEKLSLERSAAIAEEFAKYTKEMPKITPDVSSLSEEANKTKDALEKGADSLSRAAGALGDAGGGVVGITEAMAGLQAAALKQKAEPGKKLVELTRRQLAYAERRERRDEKHQAFLEKKAKREDDFERAFAKRRTETVERII